MLKTHMLFFLWNIKIESLCSHFPYNNILSSFKYHKSGPYNLFNIFWRESIALLFKTEFIIYL